MAENSGISWTDMTTKERPILFSGAMVRAILEGRKTQTRRIIAPQPSDKTKAWWCVSSTTRADVGKWTPKDSNVLKDNPQPTGKPIKCPFGDFGDRLWVKETWCNYPMAGNDCLPGLIYQATNDCIPKWKWQLAIHMPREASRIALDIVSVRVERLNDIGEADAMAEGVSDVSSEDGRFRYGDIEAYFNYPIYQRKDPKCYLAKWSFKHLWESINDTGSWVFNPWVWVVEFRTVG